jgi:putative Ca2+/H+ antiporter (TMEM165/GDT1 family)
MNFNVLMVVFVTVFVAELGDKTQLATMLFAADREASRLAVFLGSALALTATSGLGVLAGGLISQYLSPRHLAMIAGTGFIVIGMWTLVKAFLAE